MCNLKSTPERNEKQADRAIPRVTQRQRTFEIIRRSPEFSEPGTKKRGRPPSFDVPCSFYVLLHFELPDDSVELTGQCRQLIGRRRRFLGAA